MGKISDLFASAFRDFTIAGVPASGPHDPVKSEIRAAGAEVDRLVTAGVAGLTTVPTIAARDTFYATPDNRSKLVYVSNNNGSATDPANGVYEYVGGSARRAEAFYDGLADVVQPLVDEATDARDQAVSAAASFSIATSANAIERTNAQVFSGATALYDTLGRARGLRVAAGSTGAPSLVQLFMPIGYNLPVGSVVRFAIDATTSNPFNRFFGLVLQILLKNGTTVNRPLSNDQTTSTSTAILYRWEYTIQGDEAEFWPYMQINASQAAAQEQTVYIDRAVWRVTNSLDPLLSVSDLNLAIMQKRTERNAAATAAGSVRAVTVKDDGTGDYSSLAAAMAAITDASISNRYAVRIYPKSGGWPVVSVRSKDYVDWEGVGPERVWLRGYQDPASTTPAQIAANSTVDIDSNTSISNLKITMQNGRYPVHADKSSMIDKTIRATNCYFEHLGNAEAATYYAGQEIWSSVSAWGMGTWSGFEGVFTACQFVTPNIAAMLSHNQASPGQKPSKVSLRYCRFQSGDASKSSLVLQSFNMGQISLCELVGNKFIGPVSSTIASGTAQEWLIYGAGNTGFAIASDSPAMKQMLTDFTA